MGNARLDECKLKLLGIIDEDIVNYKKISMSLMFPYCSMKCNKESGREVCQNSNLSTESIIEVKSTSLVERYLRNPLTRAVCCYGMEPMDSFSDLLDFVQNFRLRSDDDIIIYTGYNKIEISDKIELLQLYKNIIVKFGRFIPDSCPHYDEVLGVKLASINQYAERIS